MLHTCECMYLIITRIYAPRAMKTIQHARTSCAVDVLFLLFYLLNTCVSRNDTYIIIISLLDYYIYRYYYRTVLYSRAVVAALQHNTSRRV